MKEESEEKELWYKGPIKWVIGVFLLLLIVMMVIPYYGIRSDPEPKRVVSLEDVNEFIVADTNRVVDGLDKVRGIYDRNDAQIKFAADKIVAEGCDENIVCYAKALYYFVRDEISYVSDPVEREYIEAPEIVLKTGAADCESGSLLLLNMMESIGINGEIVIIPGHAFIRVKLDKASGRYKHDGWIYMDWTCNNCGFGEVPYGSINENMRFLNI
ncbi:transglutaminase-like domain-containing protein [Candidatus Woesearchaeota archaeon]|nr:transglutaminase-like domain-containing protein [Candidatus Woesearchaeota archaeon]